MIDRKRLIAELRAIATPVDFDVLVKKGVLRKKGRQYVILAMKRLPAYARKQITSITMRAGEPPVATFMKSNKVAQKLLADLTRASPGVER